MRFFQITQDLVTDTLRGRCVRFSKWYSSNCTGASVHAVCNFGVGDLGEIRVSPCLVANKFNVDVDAAALLCQAKYLSEEHRRELLGGGTS